ncbi:CHC2 zinc finger domain-containing protein [Arcobacter sp. YIC-80]|uniref:CHC2 zinc finger domain-containing protein n=1 Tax=Arcobacter sp. YIC-80 TaxID=3376683 RepID=UPI00385107B8
MKYDKEKLNSIDILEVSNMLGIKNTSKKGIPCFNGHDSKSPSLHFYHNTNTFYCFGCGIGTKNINLVMEYCDVSFLEACEILEKHFFGNSPYQRPKRKITYQYKIDLFSHDSEVYQWILDNSTLSQRGLDYLQDRGYSLETIRKQRIFDISNTEDFFKSLRKKWDDERLYKCGLLKTYDNGFSNCWWCYTIVFPCLNLKSQVINLEGRYIDHEHLRWVHLPNVKSSIYNLQILDQCNIGEKVYICEGVSDTLSMLEKGYKAIGIMGATNFKKEYIYYFMDYDIYVIPDNDNGGDNFYKNIVDAFSLHKSIKRITFDRKYNDISDYFKESKNVK